MQTNLTNPNIFFMREALEQAKLAYRLREVPVGAVIVLDNEIISRGFNMRETAHNALKHAEITAIEKACEKLHTWRLWNCSLYVTMEPCPMCAGAIINARIPKVVFGAYDYKNGCCGSVINLFEQPFTHKPDYEGGILQQECGNLLSDFFKELRK